jgi:NADH dehydrogenase
VKVAVTGGTGFVGRHLVNRLLKDNHEITVLTHLKSADNLFASKVRLVSGSVDSTAEMVPAFQGAAMVFHLIGIIAETRTKTFEKTVAQGTRNVMTACREAGVKKIFYLSALGTSSNAVNAYFRTKFVAEETVKDSRLNWTIFRPSIIYGQGDGFLTLISKLIKLSPIVPIFGSGNYRMQPVYIDDLTEAMAKAALMPGSNGQTIDIGGPERLEYVTVINKIKKALKKKRLNIHIPFAVITPVAALLEKLLKPAPLTKDQLSMLKMGSVGDITAMRTLLGIEPRKFEDGLKLVFGE